MIASLPADCIRKGDRIRIIGDTLTVAADPRHLNGFVYIDAPPLILERRPWETLFVVQMGDD